jgi:hypothetical protein
MNIEEILDMLDDLIDKAWGLPLTGGRCVVDAEKVRDLIDDIRLNCDRNQTGQGPSPPLRPYRIMSVRGGSETLVQKAEDPPHLIAQRKCQTGSGKGVGILSSGSPRQGDAPGGAGILDDMLNRRGAMSDLSDIKSTRSAIANPQKNKLYFQPEQPHPIFVVRFLFCFLSPGAQKIMFVLHKNANQFWLFPIAFLNKSAV